jgi:hypothetical protein
MTESDNKDPEISKQEFLVLFQYELLFNNIEIPSWAKWVSIDSPQGVSDGAIYVFLYKPIIKLRSGAAMWDVNPEDYDIIDKSETTTYQCIGYTTKLSKYHKISLVSVDELCGVIT